MKRAAAILRNALGMTNQLEQPGDDTIATPADRRAAFCSLSGRGYTQLRHLLVQLPSDRSERHSTIARMLRGRKHRELVLYLFLMMCWPWLEERKSPLEAEVWTAALTTQQNEALTWTRPTLSRAWGALEKDGLVTKTRKGRLLQVAPRREDGAAPYEAPAGRKDHENTYFTLPDAFWLDELFAKLSQPELVMFLFFLSETQSKDEVHFTYAQIEQWYGMSVSSVKKGVDGLKEKGLLAMRVENVKDAFSPDGSKKQRWYSLTGPYSRQARKDLQAKAVAETKQRRSTKGVKKHEVGRGETVLEDSEVGAR